MAIKASIRLTGRVVLCALIAVLPVPFIGGPAHAQIPSAPSILGSRDAAPKTAPEPAEDPLGRRTPYGTVLGFIKASERRDLDRAAEYLDSQQLPKQSRLLAQELADILDAADLREPSRNPEGSGGEGLPSNRESVGVLRTASGKFEIFLDRVDRAAGQQPIWLFSADTLKQVPRIHGELREGWIERHLSGTFLETTFLGYPLWHLIGILLALPLSFLIAGLATRLLVPAFPGLLRRIARRPVEYPAARLKWPVNLLIMAAFFYLVSRVDISAAGRLFWAYLSATVATIALTWLSIRLLDDLGLFGGSMPSRLGSGGIGMARLMDRFSKAVVVFLGVLVLSYIAGVNLTALLAGVGIGGIAIALAAQKSLENLFGAMTILTDKPIRVGDFCRAGEFTGTVVDIGLRSTRIKTVERTVVSVPNGLLIGLSLENFSLRDKILFNPRIHLGYETTAEQLRTVVGEIRYALARHPRVEAQTARTSVVAFREQSIEVEVFAYVLDTSYDAFLIVQEELLLRIMDIVHAEGVKFAMPVPVRPLPGPRRAA